MTADQARKLVAEATSSATAEAQAMIAAWRRAIEKAAREGRSFVRGYDVDRPRMPIRPVAHAAALAQLAADGFEVKTVTCGPNEDTTEVSW